MTIAELNAKLDEAIKEYQRAKANIAELSLQVIAAVAREHAPTATVVVLDDSDQPGTEYVFDHFEDADGNEVDVDSEVVDDLIWGPVSNLEESDVLGYRIDIETAA